MTEWVHHRSWQQPDGDIFCAWCGMKLPRIVPVEFDIYMKGHDVVSVGARKEARKCTESLHGR